MNDQTKIEDLNFVQVWRLKRSVSRYNRTVDRKARIETVGDLRKLSRKDIIDFLGVGKKTLERIEELLNAPR